MAIESRVAANQNHKAQTDCLSDKSNQELRVFLRKKDIGLRAITKKVNELRDSGHPVEISLTIQTQLRKLNNNLIEIQDVIRDREYKEQKKQRRIKIKELQELNSECRFLLAKISNNSVVVEKDIEEIKKKSQEIRVDFTVAVLFTYSVTVGTTVITNYFLSGPPLLGKEIAEATIIIAPLIAYRKPILGKLCNTKWVKAVASICDRKKANKETGDVTSTRDLSNTAKVETQSMEDPVLATRIKKKQDVQNLTL